MDHRPHIVVVEDEATQRQLLVDYLDKQNFRVSGAEGGVALRRLVERELPALVLLDVGLPGEDGFALARWLREKQRPHRHHHGDGRVRHRRPRGRAGDRRRRLHRQALRAARAAGARSRACCAASTGAPAASGPRVRMGRRVLDLEKRVLVDPADGSEETLTASEFDLLKMFAENPTGRCSATGCWKRPRTARWRRSTAPSTCAITRLRRKIEADPAHPDAIRTVRGVGYMFVPPKD